jgi:hypothetical protein
MRQTFMAPFRVYLIIVRQLKVDFVAGSEGIRFGRRRIGQVVNLLS